jgi:phytoene desaturase
MNFADFGLGTWHPNKGMYSVVEGIVVLAKELGVKFHNNQNIEKIIVKNDKIKGVKSNGKNFDFDIVLSGADYNHSESLLDKEYRVYSKKFWAKKVFAPSSLLFFVGINKKIKNVSHHTLFFDVDFDNHAKSIYDSPEWPKEPLFYGNFPSITDKTMAPKGKESCFFLIPIASGIEDSQKIRENYFKIIIDRLEKLTGQSIKEDILFKKSYCLNNFVEDYNSYKGNAYGLANTLMQTAFLRPKLISKKVKNLYFTGQLTVPGPGVPPALISGKLVSEIIKTHNPEV